MDDPYNLRRFVDAQQAVYETVCRELRQGRKQSHWMWFIFPQIKGLGHSEMARKFAISSRDEAKAYLAHPGHSAMAQKFAISSREEAEAYLSHPILGPRLRECSRIVADLEGKSVEDIFGYPDDMKFRSSMTLFARAAPRIRIRKYSSAMP